MREIDAAGNRVPVGAINGDELVTFTEFALTLHPQVGSRASLLANGGTLKQFNKRQRTSIQDGKLKVVELHNCIINSRSNACREKVLGSGDQDASFHQTGGVTDPSNITGNGF